MESFIFAGELASLGTAVCWSATAVFFSYSGRIIGSDVVNRSRLLFALLFLSLSHLLLEGSFFPTQVEGFRWFWLTVSSVLGLVIGDTLLFKAYVMIGARLSMLLMSTVPIISVLFGWLLFGETVTGLELTAVFLTVGGVAWVVTEKQPGRTAVENKQFSRGILFGLGGALGQVANLVTAKYGLVGGFSTISATVIRIFVAVLFLWGITLLQGQVRATLRQWGNREAFPAMIGGSIAGPFLGIWLSLIAIQLTRLGIASTLMALPPVLLIPVEFVVFKKPVSVRGMIGTAVAFIGVMLLFLPQS